MAWFPLRSLQLCALALGLGLACGAFAAPPAPAACDDQDAGYVKPLIETSDTVFIFVHGLAGAPVETWRPDAEHSSWPCLLRRDEAFRRANFYLVGYPTGLLDAQPRIEQVAQTLADQLSPVLERHDQAVFVLHSMGGLVVPQALMQLGTHLAHRHLVRRVRLLLFFGTPGQGSDLAELAKRSDLALQLTELGRGEVADQIVERWKRFEKLAALSRCFAETQPPGSWWSRLVVRPVARLFGAGQGLVVDEPSAFSPCDGRGAALPGTNHFSLVKPAHTQHVAYLTLAQQVQACVRPPRDGDEDGSLAGTPQAQRVRTWRERFHAQLLGANPQEMEETIRAHLALPKNRPPDEAAFIAPEDDSALLPAQQQGELGLRHFVQTLASQAVVGPNQAQRQVARVGRLDRIVFDGAVRARVTRLRQAGLLLDDDIAVLVANPADRGDDLILLLSDTDAEGERARLKGYLRLSVQPPCQGTGFSAVARSG